MTPRHVGFAGVIGATLATLALSIGGLIDAHVNTETSSKAQVNEITACVHISNPTASLACVERVLAP